MAVTIVVFADAFEKLQKDRKISKNLSFVVFADVFGKLQKDREISKDLSFCETVKNGYLLFAFARTFRMI